MGTLWELWVEIGQDSESLADPVMLECFQAGQSHRIFDSISDEDLRSVLSKIKGLLNEPKTREKGASVLNQLGTNVETERLIGLQEPLLSALRLICNDKSLKSHIVQSTLANLLPKCKQLPDILKELTPKNSFITKIVSSCLEEFQSVEGKQPGLEVLKLLKTCLENYKGPCGNYRERLEKCLIPFLDHDNSELVHLVCGTLPLLSQTGGGGSRGDNHSKDWLAMVMKLIREAYDCVYQLYSDCCALDEENPFVRGESNSEPLLPQLLEKKVFLKITMLKKRLSNLLTALSAYLRNSFPSSKPVPARSVLKLVGYLISINPVELLQHVSQNARKEVIFLAALIPSIHSQAFKLVEDLVICLGTNLLPDAVVVEQLFSQQWRWMDNRRKAFEELKLDIYTSLNRWLSMTQGQVSNPKTLKLWVEFFIKEIQLEKDTVELKLVTNSKKSKQNLNRLAPTNSNGLHSFPGAMNHNSFVSKSSRTCEAGLNILIKLIPSLDAGLHKNVYSVFGKTQAQIYQQGSFPSPYDDFKCRLKINESLLELALNPHPRSVISLGLIINLLRKGCQDPVSKVSKYCHTCISTLERLLHPSSQSMEFPAHILDPSSFTTSVDRSSAILNNLTQNSDHVNDTVEETITFDRGCQTEITGELKHLDKRSKSGSESDSGESVEDLDVYISSKSANNPAALNAIMAELKSLRAEVGEIRKPPQMKPNSDLLGKPHHTNTNPLGGKRRFILEDEIEDDDEIEFLEMRSSQEPLHSSMNQSKRSKGSIIKSDVTLGTAENNVKTDPKDNVKKASTGIQIGEGDVVTSQELIEMFKDFVDE